MWTKRDWTQVAVVGVGACALTLASLSTGALTAQQQKAEVEPKAIATPTLSVGRFKVSARVAEDEQVAGVKDGMVTVKADATPGVKLVVVNDGTSEETETFTATMMVQSISDMLSRVPRPMRPGWTESYTVTLGAGDSKTLEASPGLKIAAGASGMLTLQAGEVVAGPTVAAALRGNSGIVALQFTGAAGGERDSGGCPGRQDTMRRRSPAIVGACLGLAVGLLLSTDRARQGAVDRGAMLDEYGGPLRSVVMQYTKGADFVWPVYRQFLMQQGAELTVYVACPAEGDFAELREAVGEVGCRVVPVYTRHEMTTWSRDRWVVLQDARERGRPTLLAQAGEVREEIWPQRAGDGKVFEDLARAVGFEARRSALFFDGGDLLADGDWVFATRAVLERNLQHRVATREELVGALEREVGRRVVLLADGPDHHAGMFMMAAGARRMVVADPALGREVFDAGGDTAAGLAGGADFTAETQQRFDAVAAVVRAKGYSVTRIPAVPAHEGKMYLTYVNVIIDKRDARDVVYMPVYAGQERMNAAATAVWAGLGFEVRPIDCTSVWQRGGALHCLVNVLERGKGSRPG